MAIKALKAAQHVNHQLDKTPVAIIGMSSILPQAPHLQDYWDNILNKINCVTEVPDSRWSINDYYDPDPSKPDKSYCKRGGFLPDIEFGLPPNILEVTDISQLLSLVVAKEALEDAGYGEGIQFNRENTGVILGVVGVSSKLYIPLMSRLQYPVWEKVLKASGVSDEDTQKLVEKFKLAYVNWEENSFPGSLPNIVAGRIANRFDLGGTNCVLDAACATSMAAIKMAVMELVEGRMDMMITGGVDTDNSIGVYMSFSKTPAFSKGESVRTFDVESDGMMAGEGLGMLVLKRLADAERDGDRIYAVIRGIGSSSDGRYKSIYAPRASGQAIALRRAYKEAGYDPATVGLIEAHGTGTPAGDPAEFQGLREVFLENNPDRQYIALGSVKSQIAHTKGTAGSAGMIKAALALHHKILPPTINVTRPNPKFDIENTPFYINTETRPWFRRKPDVPRRASVSAFGFGGTNFHITLEEYSNDHTSGYRKNSVAQALLFSAPNPAALLTTCQDALSQLKSDQGSTYYHQLAAQTQSLVMPQEHARLGFVASSLLDAQEMLQSSIDLLRQQSETTWEHPKGIYYRQSGMDSKGKVVALFSGQGSQYLEMGRELACNFPPMRQVIAGMDSLFIESGLAPLSTRIFPPPVFDQASKDRLSDDLMRTEHAQPAIGAFSMGLYKLLQQAGYQPDFVAGHSFGELTALWAAGVINDQDYLALALARGQAMSSVLQDDDFDSGAMLAVKADVDQILEDIKAFPDITLANWNTNSQVVLAGSKQAITQIQEAFSRKGYSVVLLPVSAAFHTPLVKHAQEPFAAAIQKARFKQPQISLYSNTSGQRYDSNPDEIQRVLAGHMLNPVLFKDEIERIYADGGQIFVEFGPKAVLTNLVKDILEKRAFVAVALNANPKKDSDRQLREAVVQLRVIGLPLTAFDPYQVAPSLVPARKKSSATVKLNGGAYVSPKTRAAFEKSLQDGFKVSSSAAAVIPAAAPSSPAISVPAASIAAAPIPASPAPVHAAPQTGTSFAATTLGQSLAQYHEHQSEVLRLHQQYLQHEESYAKVFARLSEMEINLLSNAAPEQLQNLSAMFESLERSMARFHDHQSETLQTHNQYLKSQEDFSQNIGRLVQQQFELMKSGRVEMLPPTPAANPAPAPISRPAPAAPVTQASIVVEKAPAVVEAIIKAPQASQYDTETLTQALLKVVSEKTGYPIEMLDLNTDMESDLGIDSIKRVEIMGAMREQFSNLPKVDPETFAQVHTLGQTVAYMNATQAGSTATAAVEAQTAPVAAAAVPQQPLVSEPAAPPATYDPAVLTSSLLAVVSDKTGYPVEMLDLNTDMESDLGIDSIKRVEIMGAMRSQFPNLPKVDPETFALVRTLGQTVAYMGTPGDVSTPVIETAPPTAAAAVTAAPATPAPEPPSAHSRPAPSLVDAGLLKETLLRVVSDKTGYPVEMLDLNTDMESDLGIDSIKRVEIMGGMREIIPTLPKVDPETFAEVHTLGQIIDYLNRSEPAGGTPTPADIPVDNKASEYAIPRGLVNLKTLPAPDFASFNLPENHICLLTDDGTPATVSLARELVGRSWKVVVLSLPRNIIPSQPPLPQGVERVTLADLSEEQLQQRLAEITTRFGPVAALVHMNPSTPSTSKEVLFSKSQIEIIKMVFLLAKHLKEPLTGAGKQEKSAFMVVTRMDGEFGLGNRIDFDPISGGLFGLVKTLNLEWESVYCRAVDISPEVDVENATRHIIAELHDPNRLITEVAYNPQERSTLVVEQAQLNEVGQ